MPDILFAFSIFFFNDTATTEIYTLSLHDALPISQNANEVAPFGPAVILLITDVQNATALTVEGNIPTYTIGTDDADRKSTRLNSIHSSSSYAVFCLKKTKQKENV